MTSSCSPVLSNVLPACHKLCNSPALQPLEVGCGAGAAPAKWAGGSLHRLHRSISILAPATQAAPAKFENFTNFHEKFDVFRPRHIKQETAVR